MDKPKYIINDCHNHLVDFLQESDGIHVLLEKMNESGVDHAMIDGMMVMKKWEDISPSRPHYYLDDDAKCYWYASTDLIVAMELQKLAQKDRKRFHPFLCGFNPTDRNAIDHIKRMVKYFPDFWHGIGEIFTRHDDLTALTYGETGRANHIALDPIYEFAAQNDWPVYVHSNIASVADHRPIYLHELQEALKNHPKTRIIWCHSGVSRRIHVPDLTRHVEKMLTAHDNLFIDLSWVAYDFYLVKKKKAAPEWVQLIKQFPDRFIIGSDQAGHFENYKESIHRFYKVLDELEPEDAKKIAYTNFLRILPKNM